MAHGAWAAPDVRLSYVPLNSSSAPTPSVSADGRYIAYEFTRKVASGSVTADIYIRDVVTGTDTQANLKVTGGAPTVNPLCDSPSISGDGRYVAFVCLAAPMGETAPSTRAYFVYDRLADRTEMVPTTSAREGVNPGYAALSSNSRYLAFRVYNVDTGVNKIYIRDLINRTTTATNAQYAGVPGAARMFITPDARFISYSGRFDASKAQTDVYVYDAVTGVTETQSLTLKGTHSIYGGIREPSASDDANIIVFSSDDPGLISPSGPSAYSIYMRDRKAGTTEILSRTLPSWQSAVSGNGRYVAFLNNSIRVYDRLTKTTREIVASGGRTPSYPSISANGRYVVFNGIDPSGSHTIVIADMGVEAGLILSSKELSLTEAGMAATYTLVLTQAPDADVKVAVKTGSQLALARSELVFTRENWNVPQVVSVQAVADGIPEGRHTAVIVHTVTSSDVNYSVVQAANVTATITDGVTPTIVVPAATWNRSDLPLTGTAAPGATVLLTAVNRTTGWMSAVSTVSDQQGQWSYTLTGVTDGIVDLDAQADGIKSAVRTVAIKLAAVPPPPTFLEVTGNIRTTAYGLILNRSTGRYAGNFVLTNTGSIPLMGPLQLRLDNLTAGVALFNATGSHEGAPYITVPEGLAPDQSVTIPLLVTNPAKATVSYDARIFSGNF